MYACTCFRVYMHAYIEDLPVSLYAHTYTHTRQYIYTYISTYIRAPTYVHTYIYEQKFHKYAHHAYVYVALYTYVHMYMHTGMTWFTRNIHTYICTCIQDGFRNDVFHKKVDLRGPTLTIVRYICICIYVYMWSIFSA